MPLPLPEPALVIHYEFLWSHEFRKGEERGAKRRACVIMLVEESGNDRLVTVAPITHLLPSPDRGVLIPLKVKQHLGLDEHSSWIIIDELNRFLWPGIDIHPVPGRALTFEYGFLPRKLFYEVRDMMLALENSDRSVIARTE